MKTSATLRIALTALPLALFSASCVTDGGWDGYGYDRPPPRRYADDFNDGRARPPRRPPRDPRWDGGRHGGGPSTDVRDDRPAARTPAAHIPKGFVRAGAFSAGGAAESGIPTSRTIKKVLLVATSGSVTFNTMVVRQGGAKTSYTVSTRLAAGQTREIDLGGAKAATGLRVSTGGKGTYEVYVH